MLPNRDQRSVSHPPNPLFLLSLTVEPLSPIKPPQQSCRYANHIPTRGVMIPALNPESELRPFGNS